MKLYKKLLLGKLADSGWELLEQCDGMQWWLDESWRIRSVKRHWGFELLILFLVDRCMTAQIRVGMSGL